MIFGKFIREMAFNLARRDLALFLEDHEDDLIFIFRQELQRLDDDIPEEDIFIDIKIVPMGELILKAALVAVRRFLTEELATEAATQLAADVETMEHSA